MEDLKLQDTVIFLAAAGVVIPLAKRWNISPVLGFLLVGLAVGPYGFARLTDALPALQWVLITDVAGVRALAELGVIFLLFMIGLELSVHRLWSMRRWVFGMGNAQILVTALCIGLIAWGFGNSPAASMVLGACLALSSTAIVMQLLIEQGNFGTVVGRSTFSLLLAQDIAVVPILFLVGTLGTPAGGSLWANLGLAVGEAVIAVLLIYGIGRIVIRPLFRFVGSSGAPELFMAVTLLTIIATAALTHAAGLSAALGAFLAGLLLAESEYRHEIEIDIEPFKGLLLGLFFMSVAMGIDLSMIAANPGWILASVVGLFALKATITTIIGRLFGLTLGQSAEMGLLLGQGGEFAFVVVGMALGFSLLPVADAQFMLIVVGATMFLTPLVARLARAVGQALDTQAEQPDSAAITPDLANHVVIVGYGRTGQLLAKLLDQQQIAHVALDLDAAQVQMMRAQGAPVVLGDASRRAMLEKVRLPQAAALAVCTDDPQATERTIASAQRLARDVPIVARVHSVDHGQTLLAHGATRVVPEVCESALQLGALMLEQVGVPPHAVRDVVEGQRIEMMFDLQDNSSSEER